MSFLLGVDTKEWTPLDTFSNLNSECSVTACTVLDLSLWHQARMVVAPAIQCDAIARVHVR